MDTQDPAIRGVSIVQFNAPFEGAGTVAKNTCIVSPGRSDRRPTGTGLSARLAVLHARGLLKVGETFSHLSSSGRVSTGGSRRRPPAADARPSFRRSPDAPTSPA